MSPPPPPSSAFQEVLRSLMEFCPFLREGSVAAAAAAAATDAFTAYREKPYVPVHFQRALPHQVLKQRHRSAIAAL